MQEFQDRTEWDDYQYSCAYHEEENMSNREYRSDVFSMLMEYPEYALDVYKALGGNKDATASMVEIKTLEKGISLSVRNDAAFIIDTDINLYEHQSTYNPNMPLRSLIYLVEILKPLLKEKDLYGRRRISIPKPKFVVFYNGAEDRPEIEVQKLSDAYDNVGETSDSMELICTVYNINPERNDALLKASYVLAGYMTFVNKIRELKDSDKDNELVVEEAVEYCIKEHILDTFFINRKAEVIKQMTLDMTFEAREKIFRKEEYEDGFAEGKAEGKAEAYINLLKEGLITANVAAEKMGCSVEEAKKYMDK